MNILTLNLHLKDIETGGWKSLEKCNKYPGARWMYYFCRLAEEAGFVIQGTETVLNLLLGKSIDPKDVYLLQEGHNDNWDKLAELGVTKTVLFNFESPMYAPDFYDRLDEKALPVFSKRFGFPNYDSAGPIFPSYDKEDIIPFGSVPKQDRYVTILSNKNFQLMGRIGLAMKASKNFQWAILCELHTERAKKMLWKIFKNEIDIYGQGWEYADIWGIKDAYGKPIEPVANKLEVMSRYKYALCYENVGREGYCTEKIIDAYLAGCEPVTNSIPYSVLFKLSHIFEFEVKRYQDWLYETEIKNPFSHKFMASEVMKSFEGISA